MLRSRNRGVSGGGAAPALSFSLASGTIVGAVAGASGITPTFTRATTDAILDWEGKWYAILSGEVPFWGLRRVRNHLVNSEVFTTASNALGTATITAGATDPLGGTAAYQVDFPAAADRIFKDLVSPSTGTFIESVWLRADSAGTIQLIDALGAGFATVVNVTTSWQRFCSDVGSLQASSQFGIRRGVAGQLSRVYMYRAQMENVLGQSNQAPSENLPTGVLSSPYYGANVDGVKYFNTLNGNTVASNVVTEATGASIPRTGYPNANGILVPPEYFPEPQSTNLVARASDFSANWAAIGTPTRSAAASRCGSFTLDLIGDDSAAALEGYSVNNASGVPFTFTGDAVKAISLLIRQGTSTSSVVRLRDTTAAADRLLAAVTWSAGNPVVTMTTGTAMNGKTGQAGWEPVDGTHFRILVASTSVTAANNNQLEIYPATDAALSVANTGDVYAGVVMAENATVPSRSIIDTTTAAVTRNADQMAVTSLGTWFNAAAGTLIVRVVNHPSATLGRVATFNDGTSNERVMLYNPSVLNPGFIVSDGGVIQANLGMGAVSAGAAALAGAWAVNDFAAVANAGTVQTDVSGTLPTVTQLEIGQETGTAQLAGGIQSLDYYNTRLTNAQLQSLTT